VYRECDYEDTHLVFQCVTLCCGVLRCGVCPCNSEDKYLVCCIVLQYVVVYCSVGCVRSILEDVAVRCGALQCVAV